MKSMFKVISQSEPVAVTTQNGQTQKSVLVLQECGGRYENSYVASLLGNQIMLAAGAMVWASLRFTAREYKGSMFMDCTVGEIIPL